MLVNRSGETLSGIVAAVKRVTDIVAEIATASREQAVGLEEVSRAIVSMDDVTQKNSALVEEAASAAQMLQQQAAALREMLAGYQVEELLHIAGRTEPAGAAAGPTRPQAPPVRNSRAALPARRAAVAGTRSEDWDEF